MYAERPDNICTNTMSEAAGLTDLHCHSTASDGALAPAELVAHAARSGITRLALTDHDSVDGLPEAARAAAELGIDFVSGVEISVSWQGKVLHVLGLNVDPDHSVLRAGLAQLQQRRSTRAGHIAARLEKLGLSDALARAQAQAAGGQITRTHFARLLVADGRVSDLKQAFKRFLGAGKSGDVRIEWAGLDEAIGWIHAAGGLAVLAHPLSYKFTGAWRTRALAAFKAAGGDGLEVSCGASQKPDEIALCAAEARRHELLASVGSDLHDPAQRWIPYGRLAPLPADLTPVWSRFA